MYFSHTHTHAHTHTHTHTQHTHTHTRNTHTNLQWNYKVHWKKVQSFSGFVDTGNLSGNITFLLHVVVQYRSKFPKMQEIWIYTIPPCSSKCEVS